MEGPPEAKRLKVTDKGMEENTFPCDSCNHIFASKKTLKRHKEAKHEGIRYPCDQCEYSATQMSHLNKHKEAKHEGIRYPCDQCKYISAYSADLKRHKKSKHYEHKYTAMQSANIGGHHKKEISKITMKVKVMVEKLSLSKYQDYLEHVQEPEFIEVSEMCEVDKEIKTEEDIDPLLIIHYDDSENNTTMVDIKKRKTVNSDCETKIEQDEDFVLKTESSDKC